MAHFWITTSNLSIIFFITINHVTYLYINEVWAKIISSVVQSKNSALHTTHTKTYNCKLYSILTKAGIPMILAYPVN